ncbi:hypothetical protein VIGAN_10117600 [Vigna angularis var. angularis]|uniref:Fungal lipase-type domain-containing protein n=1 Tax=Vigna angularis var. angularis TaxID=157739 RepID=A0A0S3T3F7_PHAAN|nr:hypothetical protein VIGAN_10117600 [Vigna angularis var. angularis]
MATNNRNYCARVERRALEAPKNLMQAILILAEAIMLFFYTERCHIFNLHRAIAHAVLDKGKKTIESECRERSDCAEVKGRQILEELYELKRLLRCAMLFGSRKRVLQFRFAGGFDKEDVLYRKRTSRIVGHSLGGGTAALLTLKLREIQQFSSTTCVTFGPAACMTWELAEFGKPFIISIVNGSDIVPTLSASSVHDFIAEGRNKGKISTAKAIAKLAVNCCTEVVKKHKHSFLPWSQRENINTLSDNLGEASGSSGTSFEPFLTEELLLIESIDDDEYDSSSERSDNDDDEEKLLNQMGNLELGKCTKEKDITEDSVSQDTTSARRRLYPPGRIIHMVTSQISENSNSNHSDADDKHVCLYQTPTQLYGKLRFSRGMILDHPTKKYLKKLQQLINKLEKE